MTIIPEHPSISIIVPAYNEEKYIRGRIENLLGLDYPKGKLEIIIVDDGSTDKTFEIAKQYPVKLVRIEHSGPAKAKNVGLEHATGELISTQDAHDLGLDKEYLKKIAKAYLKAEKNADVITIKTISYSLSKSLLAQSIFVREYLRDVYLDARSGTVARVSDSGRRVAQKDFFRRVGGYDSRLGAFEDVCLAYKFDQNKIRIIHSDDATYKAEGGAVTNLSEFIGRHMWRGKAIFGMWKYSKGKVLKVTAYALYFGLLLVAFMAVALGRLPSTGGALFLVPFLAYTLRRTLSILIRMKQFTIAGLLPILDFLHGIALFLGVTKGLISKVLGRYTPYK